MNWFPQRKIPSFTAPVLVILLLVTGCSRSQAADEEAETSNLTSQEQALGSDDSDDKSDIGLAALSCPPDTVDYKLQLNHTFDFSPGRQTDLMMVSGHTSPNAWCLVSVTGTKVQADACIVDYDYNGFVQGDDGRCDISGSDTALISIEGECIPGSEWTEIYLTLTETGNPDASGVGTLNCPEHPPVPYGGFYPPSSFIATFSIDTDPQSDTDNGPDPLGQFEYTKQYTLIPPPLPDK